MLTKESIGKRLIVETSDCLLLEEEKFLLEDLMPAGIMLRSRNFLKAARYENWIQDLDFLITDIRNIIGENIIICIDHEGHKITRAPDPITRFPYASRWRDRSAAVAAAMATELCSLGVNLTFAPCLDIHSNPQNPVINERAFGQSIDEVVGYALPFIEELKKYPIESCGKHFPGHGNTSEDSHYTCPILNSSLEELKKLELQPFEAAITAGIKFIMTAHILFPQIDKNNFATFSDIFLRDILRLDLGFKGIVVADAFCMEPVLKSLATAESTIQAINAELDLLTIIGPGTDLNTAKLIRDYIFEGLNTGAIIAERHEASCERIKQQLAQMPINQVSTLTAETLQKHGDLAFELWQRDSWAPLEFSKNHIITE